MPDYLTYPATSLWAIEENALTQITAAMANLVHAGPIEDVQRMGVPVSKIGNTAVIRIDGPMTKHATILSMIFGGAGMSAVSLAIRAAILDTDIGNIALVVDSPGGSIDGLLSLMADIRAAAQIKPVHAQVDGMAASAAWFVASQATSISIGPTDIVGSVGVQLVKVDFSKEAENKGIKVITINTGKFKSAGVPGTEITDEHIEHFQGIVDSIFAELSKAAMKSRGMTKAQFAQISDGRLHVGADAITLGLADKIQSVSGLMAALHNDKTNQGRRRRSAQDRLELLGHTAQ